MSVKLMMDIASALNAVETPTDNTLYEVLAGLGLKLVPIPTTHIATDGTVRQSYYGNGKQPWDEMKGGSLASPFAAGSVLKYMRRTKGERAADIEKAVWYYNELLKMANGKGDSPHTSGVLITTGQIYLRWLQSRLTADELQIIVLARSADRGE